MTPRPPRRSGRSSNAPPPYALDPPSETEPLLGNRSFIVESTPNTFNGILNAITTIAIVFILVQAISPAASLLWGGMKDRRRDEAERIRKNLRWGDLLGSGNCLRYGTRVYIAKLPALPEWYDMMKGCQETEAEIHGVSMRPYRCEYKGSNEIWGHWIVDFEEPVCSPWWSHLDDEGCTAPGSQLRRFSQRLENHQSNDDWKVMCATTPTDFNGRHFKAPTSCANWRHGVYGYWDVDDPFC